MRSLIFFNFLSVSQKEKSFISVPPGAGKFPAKGFHSLRPQYFWLEMYQSLKDQVLKKRPKTSPSKFQLPFRISANIFYHTCEDPKNLPTFWEHSSSPNKKKRGGFRFLKRFLLLRTKLALSFVFSLKWGLKDCSACPTARSSPRKTRLWCK